MDFILLCALFAGIIGVILWSNRRALKDADAMAWATASEPFVVVSRWHNDTSVTETAAHIREMLRAHGNRYLNPDVDVWEYVYSAHVATSSRDFQAWQDFAYLDVIKRREAWRAQKLQWNEAAAKQQFAGQTVNVEPSDNG